MAVPFAFPEENNDAEIIIRQLSLLLSRLAVEFRKQRNENIELRSRNKLQSGMVQQGTQSNQENSNAAAVGDTLLNAITTCTFAISDLTVNATRGEIENAKSEYSSTFFDKSEQFWANSSPDLTENEEDDDEEETPVSTQSLWWSWLTPITLTRNPFWTTAVICVVGWHLLR